MNNKKWKKISSGLLAVCMVVALLVSNQSFGVLAEEDTASVAVSAQEETDRKDSENASEKEKRQEETTAEQTSEIEKEKDEDAANEKSELIDAEAGKDDEENEKDNNTERIENASETPGDSMQDTPAEEDILQGESFAEEQALEEENSTDIIFDLSKGKVVFKADKTYSGYDVNGLEITGEHDTANIYRIKQSEKTTDNSITIETINLYGKDINCKNQNSTYNIILDNVNIDCSGQAGTPDGTECEGVTTESRYYRTLAQQLNYYQNGRIYVPFLAGDDTISVNVTLQGQNYLYAQNGAGATLQYAHYPMGKTGDGKLTIKGDGSLKVQQKENDTSVNRGACIGGPMLYQTEAKNGRTGNGRLIFESGTVSAETNNSSYSAAIGGGSCSPSEMPIIFAGSTVTAKSFNTSATIGAGGGSTGIGEAAHDIEIKAGDVTVYSPVNGVGIGGGTSQQRSGGEAKNITISGGKTIVYGADTDSYGMIGGGTSRNIGSEKEERNGGAANITISGGTVVAGSIGGGSTNATNAKGGNATIHVSKNANITTDSIGGGKSVSGSGGDASVTVSGGVLNVTGTIGGGDSNSGKGGDAAINVSGGTLDCASIGGGNSDSGEPGSVASEDQEAGVVVSGGILRAGTIGGGKNTKGDIGFATAKISGGESIQGQFILANTDSSKECFFTMTGGTLDNANLGEGKYQRAQQNGGAVYLSDPNGKVSISGGTIKNSSAELGGAIYMTAGTFELSDEGNIYDCSAQKGGAVYLGDGAVNVRGGTIGTSLGNEEHPNTAEDGAGVYIAGGSLEVSGGQIGYNIANESGGGTYLEKGNLTISESGSIEHNTSKKDGGGAYLAGGSLIISGGRVAENEAVKNGGGAYLQAGDMEISGGEIFSNIAVNGAGTYLESGGLTMDGSGMILSNTASLNGGGAYLQQGMLTLASGSINNNTAQNGGGSYLFGGRLQINGGNIHENTAIEGAGAYLANGQLNVSGGTITGNTASDDGGGFYLAGGQLYITDGKIQSNRAKNGAGAYVADSTVRMFGGDFTGNIASENGGGLYVSSENQAADVVIRSGNLISNKAENTAKATDQGNGGAIAVVSSNSSTVDRVVIGVRKAHTGLNISTRTFTAFTYMDDKDTGSDGQSTTHTHADCPKIEGNQATGNGGGIYMSSSSSILDIFCLLENNNTAAADATGGSIMSVGGHVNIGDIDENDNGNNTKDAVGNIFIQSPMLVKGGNVRICGNTENPSFAKEILVDIKKGTEGTEGSFKDERFTKVSNDVSYVIEYFENFEGSGAYKSLQYADKSDIYADGSLYKHDGYKILGWDTNPEATSPKYLSGTLIGSEEQGYAAWDNLGETGALKLYAIWQKISYIVEYYPGVDDYTGKMDSQTFEYGVLTDADGEKIALRPNAFKVTGKRFVNWKTEDGREIEDQYDKNDLTLTDGKTIKLYAQWRDCTHDGKEESYPYNLSYTLNPDEDMITESCDCGGYTASVTIKGTDAYYDGTAHPATLQYSNGTLLTGTPEIVYSYKENETDNFEPMLENAKPITEGYYMASITVNGETAHVEYRIKSPADAATIDVTAQKGQHFDAPKGNDSCSVSRDDAFTVRFNVQGLNKGTNAGAEKAYQTAPVLTLSMALPSGTTIIMQTVSGYWYNNQPSGTEIALASFYKMGTKTPFSYDTSNISDEQDYRFVIDFSEASDRLTTGTELKVGLKYAYKDSDTGSTEAASDKEEQATVTVNAESVFAVTVSGSACTVTVPDDVTDTRWEQKNLVWKIAADASTQLPADARLTMTTVENGETRTKTSSLNKNGEFILPITWKDRQSYTFSLNSQQEAVSGKAYALTAELYIGSNAEGNTQLMAAEDNLKKAAGSVSLTVPVVETPAVKISAAENYGQQRVLSASDTLHIHIEYENVNTAECSIKAIIQKETESGYDGNLSEQTVSKAGDYAFSMSTTKGSGNYRVWVTVAKKIDADHEQTVLQVPYYFIVQ